MHNLLMQTEYKQFLEELRVVQTPSYSLTKDVVTVVYRNRKFRRTPSGYLKNLFLGLRSFCREQGLTEIIVPLHIWIMEGYSLEYMSMLVEAVFSKSGITAHVS